MGGCGHKFEMKHELYGCVCMTGGMGQGKGECVSLMQIASSTLRFQRCCSNIFIFAESQSIWCWWFQAWAVMLLFTVVLTAYLCSLRRSWSDLLVSLTYVLPQSWHGISYTTPQLFSSFVLHPHQSLSECAI